RRPAVAQVLGDATREPASGRPRDSRPEDRVTRYDGAHAPIHLSMNTPRAAAEQQLKTFIDKFDAKDQRLIRAVRSAVRKRFPTANELVWDNYNFFVIGYSPTERPTDSIISVAARANGVGLCFIHGAGLPDPKKRLLGSGKQTRFIRLDSLHVLAHPDVT